MDWKSYLACQKAARVDFEICGYKLRNFVLAAVDSLIDVLNQKGCSQVDRLEMLRKLARFEAALYSAGDLFNRLSDADRARIDSVRVGVPSRKLFPLLHNMLQVFLEIKFEDLNPESALENLAAVGLPHRVNDWLAIAEELEPIEFETTANEPIRAGKTFAAIVDGLPEQEQIETRETIERVRKQLAVLADQIATDPDFKAKREAETKELVELGAPLEIAKLNSFDAIFQFAALAGLSFETIKAGEFNLSELGSYFINKRRGEILAKTNRAGPSGDDPDSTPYDEVRKTDTLGWLPSEINAEDVQQSALRAVIDAGFVGVLGVADNAPSRNKISEIMLSMVASNSERYWWSADRWIVELGKIKIRCSKRTLIGNKKQNVPPCPAWVEILAWRESNKQNRFPEKPAKKS